MRKKRKKCACSHFLVLFFPFLDLAEALCLAHLNVSFAVLWLDLNAQLLLANQGSQQQEKLNSGRFIKGGLTEKGSTHPVASALSLHTARPAAVLPHKCDMLKDDRIARDNWQCLPVQSRCLRSGRHRTIIMVTLC